MANRAMHVCDEGIRPKSLHALKCVFGHFKTAPPTSTIGGETQPMCELKQHDMNVYLD